MSEPSMVFRAGFVCGLRQGWNLARWPHLELMRGEAELDYEAGYSAGWLTAQTHVAAQSFAELVPIVQAAWEAYSGRRF